MKIPTTPHLWLTWVHENDKPNDIVTAATEAVIANLTIPEALAALAVLRLSDGPRIIPITDITAECHRTVPTRIMAELARKGYVQSHHSESPNPCSQWLATDHGLRVFAAIEIRLSALIAKARPLESAEKIARYSKTKNAKSQRHESPKHQ